MKTLAPVTRAATAEQMVHNLLLRADQLAHDNQTRRREQSRVRAILNGGIEAARALLGSAWDDAKESELQLMPVANLIESGIERLAHIAGRMPDIAYEPPKEKDGDRARRQAAKLVRIVSSYDETSRMELALPQAARWLFGYGFAVFVVKPRACHGKHLYPFAELRDPFSCDPAEWGPQQQPSDLAFRRTVPVATLVEMYPELGPALAAHRSAGGVPIIGTGGQQWASASGTGTWENPSGQGVEVVEYMDAHGTWIIVPELKRLIDYIPTPDGYDEPTFQVIKRFSFDRLRGHFDSVVGLTAAMLRMNLLLNDAMEDSVHVETNVIGVEEVPYDRGRDVVNYLPPGTQVQRPVNQTNFQIFQYGAFLERQLRATSRYTAALDGESPTSFITGRGVEELKAGVDAEIREIHTAIKWGLQDLTSKMLRLDEADPRMNTTKPLVGMVDGEPFEEDYTPSRDIAGQYRVRRIYGAMAGFDDAVKIAAGSNLVGMGAISNRTFMENLDGLDNVYREEERIRHERAEGILMDNLAMAVQQGDPKAIMTFIDMMQDSETKRALKKFFTPDEPQLSPEEEAFLNGPPPGPPVPGNGLPVEPPDVQTVMSRIFGDEADVGVQTVGRL